MECKDPKAHAEFHEWKCRYCCSVAVWFCWGNTHFCEPCHQKAYELRDMAPAKLPKCGGRLVCKLKCDHPPAGDEFSLGCGACNNASNQVIRKVLDDDDKAKAEADGDEPQEDADDGSLLNAGIKAVKNLWAKPDPPAKGGRRNSRVGKKK